MLKTRVMTAVILIAVLLLVVFAPLPKVLFVSLVAAFVWFAAGEWMRLLQIPLQRSLVFQTVAAGLTLLTGMSDFGGERAMVLVFFYLASTSFWLFSAPSMLRFQLKVQPGYWGYVIGIVLLVPPALATIELHAQDPWLLIAALGAVWVADIAAYFAGRKFGRRKLAPTISPGKSWEGVMGAVIAVIIYAIILRAAVPAFAESANVVITLLIALAYITLSVVGDLFESLIKRKAGVKDSGTILPGHGGILDRIDSLLPTLPVAGALLLAFQYAA